MKPDENFHGISGMVKWQPVLKLPLPKGRKGRMVDPKALANCDTERCQAEV